VTKSSPKSTPGGRKAAPGAGAPRKAPGPAADVRPESAARESAAGATPAIPRDTMGGPSGHPSVETEWSADELRRIGEEVSKSFPLGIDRTELVLMDVAPHQVHAYWNVTTEAMAEARRRLTVGGEQAPLVLRFHGRGQAAERAGDQPFDVVVQGLQSQQAVDLLSDARRYVAELGLRGPDGTLVSLARSNEVETPAARPAQAPNLPLREMHVNTDDTPREPAPSPDATAEEPQASVPPAPARARAAAADVEPALGQGSAGMAPQFPEMNPGESPAPGRHDVSTQPAVGRSGAPVQPHPVEAPVSASASEATPPQTTPVMPWAPPVEQGLSQPPRVEAGAPPKATADPAVHIDAALLPPAGELSPVFPGGGQAAKAGDKPPAPVGIPQVLPGPGPAAVSFGSGDQPWREETAGTPLYEPVQLGPSSPPAVPGSSVPLMERLVTYSSATLGKGGPDLEINAELHVHGRARPGSELTLFGRPVPLRPDGSFSIRRTLPEGAVIIPLVLEGSRPPTTESEGI
jgi:hypothetical protein